MDCQGEISRCDMSGAMKRLVTLLWMLTTILDEIDLRLLAYVLNMSVKLLHCAVCWLTEVFSPPFSEGAIPGKKKLAPENGP